MSGDALHYRRALPRHRWLEAFARLTKARAPFTAEAAPGHAILVKTNRRGAVTLEGLGTTTSSRPLPPPPPEPTPARIAADPLELALQRARLEARARAQAEREAA